METLKCNKLKMRWWRIAYVTFADIDYVGTVWTRSRKLEQVQLLFDKWLATTQTHIQYHSIDYDVGKPTLEDTVITRKNVTKRDRNTNQFLV